MNDVEKQITRLWEAGDAWREVMPISQAHDLVRSVIGMLDRGEVRVAEVGADVVVNEWVKLAILMWFRVQEMQIIEAGPFEYVDKLPLKKGYKAAQQQVHQAQRAPRRQGEHQRQPQSLDHPGADRQ